MATILGRLKPDREYMGVTAACTRSDFLRVSQLAIELAEMSGFDKFETQASDNRQLTASSTTLRWVAACQFIQHLLSENQAMEMTEYGKHGKP
jgi:hypothetical protein